MSKENGRKIIQLSTVKLKDTEEVKDNYALVVLCNDGTLWEIDNSDKHGDWRFVPSVPQMPFSEIEEFISGVVPKKDR